MKENVRKRHFCHFRTSPWCVQFYESDVLSAYFSTIVRRKEMQRLNLAVSSIESCLHTPIVYPYDDAVAVVAESP